MGLVCHPCSATARVIRKGFLWRLAAAVLLSTWAVGCASLPSNPPQRNSSQALSTPEQTALGRLVQARRAQARARSESGLFLLDSVDSAFSSRVALIEGATRTLDLQYYAIHADASTEILLQRIRAAAQRGVRVRILLDDFNTVGDDAQVLRLGFVPGVEIRLFNPLPGSRGSLATRLLGSLSDVKAIQKRMHNKLFIADNAWGITGGRNLGDAYFGGDGKSSFVDLDVLAAGQIVRQMSGSFDRFWNDELAYPMQALLTPKDLDKLRENGPAQAPAGPAKEPAPEPPRRADAPTIGAPPPVAGGQAKVLPDVGTAAVKEAQRPPLDLARVPLVWAPAALMVDRPEKVAAAEDEGNAGDTVVEGLLSLIGQAREEVLVISPYFVPGEKMMGVFKQAIERGVRLRVLTNSLASNDAPAAHAGYARYRPELIRMGVQLHEMRSDPKSAADPAISGSGDRKASGLSLGSAAGGSKSGTSRASLHSKAVIIDRRIAVIGSMNLDLRSTLQNSEVALVVRSTALSREAARLLEETMGAGAYKVELDGDRLRWRAPPGAKFKDATSEPEAGLKLRALVNLLAPFAPDEML